jgi:hypothetical protein
MLKIENTSQTRLSDLVSVLYSKPSDPDGLYSQPSRGRPRTRRVARPRTHNWYQKPEAKKEPGGQAPRPWLSAT